MPGDGDLTPGPPLTSRVRSPLVFISYAQDDDDHQARVRELWIFLRSNGINAIVDLPATDRRQDWALWMLDNVRAARFVLVVASPEYRQRGEGRAASDEGRGVQWEAAIIREEIYTNGRSALQKFVPVVLPGRSVADIPTWLGPTTTSHYLVDDFTIAGAEGLLRLLTGQPDEVQPPLGPIPALPARDVEALATGAARAAASWRPRFATPPQQRPPMVPDHGSHVIAPIHRLFLHFFDPHFLDEVARGRNGDLVANEARRATRAAVLAAETVFVPAASYIESELCAATINEYRSLFDTGQIMLVGGEANIVDFAAAKLLQYEPGTERFMKYEAVLSSTLTTPPFRSRTGSATRDITSAWIRTLDDLSSILDGLPMARFSDLETKWAGIPEWLGERAFTPEYIVRGLFGKEPDRGPELVLARRAGSQVNTDYFRSYTTELGAGPVTDLMYLHSPQASDTNAVDLPLRLLLRELQARGVLELALAARPERLAEIRYNQSVAAAILLSITPPPLANSEEARLTLASPATATGSILRPAVRPPSNQVG